MSSSNEVYQRTLFNIVPTLPPKCREIRILDLACFSEWFDEPEFSYRYLERVGIPLLEGILAERCHRKVRRLVFTLRLKDYRQGVAELRNVLPEMLMLNFLYDRLPKASERVDFAASVDDLDAMEIPF